MTFRSTAVTVLALLILGAFSFTASAEVPPVHRLSGYKFLKNYIPEDVNILPQNWGIIQDRRGVIYSANQGGIEEYDGVSWRNIRIPNISARAIDIDENGIIYVAGYNELGLLVPGPAGKLKYQSLIDRLPASQRNLSTVYQVCCSAAGVWFRTRDELYLWKDNTFKVFQVLETDSRFKFLFSWKNKIYIQASKSGLLEFTGKKLKPLAAGGLFAGEKISFAVPYDNERLLVGLSFQGFYLFDGRNTERFVTELDEFIKKNWLYHGVSLGGGFFALGTLSGGLAIMDSHGKAIAFYNTRTGLQNDQIQCLYLDTGGNLWLGMDRGISVIEWSSAFSIYDARSGLKGQIHSITRHQGQLIAGTSSGLYYLDRTSGKTPVFNPVNGLNEACWTLLDTGDSLLIGAILGIFQMQDKIIKPVVPDTHTFCFARSHRTTDRVWAGGRNVLMILQRSGKKWILAHSIDNLKRATIRAIAEEENGTLWLGTEAHGVARIEFQEDDIKKPEIQWFDDNQGLPKGVIQIFKIDGNITFATPGGLYTFDGKSQTFVPDLILGEHFTQGNRDVYWLEQDRNRHIWFHSKRWNYHAIPEEGKRFVVSQLPFQRLPKAQANVIYSDDDSVWFGVSDRLIRFDLSAKKNYQYPFSTLIRKVIVNGEHPVYNGFNPESALKEHDAALAMQADTTVLELEYSQRNLQFDAAAVFFENETANQYRYFMEGYDTKWSDWVTVNFRNYTNLDFGSYAFHVQGRGLYGNESSTDIFRFRIMRPWYHTYWAYSAYLLLAVFGVYLIVRWRSSKLLREKEQLDRIVEERTHQLHEKTVLLEEQSDQLKEMDRIKSRFFANISHEFRTPLTLIMGPLDNLREAAGDESAKKQVDLASRNSRRLLRLINQLLDLSKFESGKMKLRAVSEDLVQFLRSLTEPFEPVAQTHGLSFTFNSQVDNLAVYFDPEKMEKIFSNLLSNALKFTPSGGAITVSLRVQESPESSGEAIISVKDTGEGIPADQLPHIFDRFYQADATAEHHRKGSGIGLSLVKELVALHHGVVSVRSSQGEASGTEFLLHLKLGRDHLTDEDIVPQLDFNSDDESPGETNTIDITEPSDLFAAADRVNETDSHIGDKIVVLVVEDNADLRRYIRSSLEPEYDVIEAEDGQTGVNKAKELIPDIVISDIMMPEKDGYELCRELKNDMSTSHIPVVLLTAKASEQNIVKGLETGADDYITKPFSTRILAARIRNLVELRRQLQLKLNREMVLQPSKISMSEMDSEFLKDLQDVIEKNLSESDFNVEDLSKRLYMSRTTVYRKIQALSGETPTDFIRSYRLMRAAQLLKNKFGSVTDVAFEVGFSSRAYFTKCFKDKFHRLPSEYMQSESGPGS